MYKFVVPTLAATMFVSQLPAQAQTPPPPPPAQARSQAAAYVAAAGKSDLYEIQSSQVALEKAQTPAIRAFAQMLIEHHEMTTAATLKAAAKAGMPPARSALDAAATASVAELQSASAADFDRLYLAQQIPAHKAALELHKGFSANGDQTDLRASAAAAVPIVQKHLVAAMELQRNGPAKDGGRQ